MDTQMDNHERPNYDSDEQQPQADFPEQRPSATRCSLRLVVQQSSVLPKLRRVAVLEGYDEIEVGRDAAISEMVPRIRLKDMEVSKHHATVFWNREDNDWAIVDVGSKHGTFLSRQTGTGAESLLSADAAVFCDGTMGDRLSQSREASLPRALHHLDMLKIGSTTFLIHVHPDGLPCLDCASEAKFDIPLFTSSSSSSVAQSRKRNHDEPELGQARNLEGVERDYDPRSALIRLKKTLLSRHDTISPRESTEPSNGATKYVDRSAKRRALFYTSSTESPGAQSRPSTPSSSDRVEIPRASSLPITSPPSTGRKPHAPISQSNIGHKLLEKQGWNPGTVLGINALARTVSQSEDSTALLEPIQVQANRGRMGIGMPLLPSGDVASNPRKDWKRRRWDGVRRDGM